MGPACPKMREERARQSGMGGLLASVGGDKGGVLGGQVSKGRNDWGPDFIEM